MSNTQEAWDDDRDWLYSTASIEGKRKPTDEQIASFCRGVTSAVVDMRVEVNTARKLVFGEVMR